MIEKWAIRENDVTGNSVYILVINGADEDARRVEKNLSGFAVLAEGESAPGFTHVLELANITDDDMLAKIRARVEQVVNEGNLNAGPPAPSKPAPKAAPAARPLTPKEGALPPLPAKAKKEEDVLSLINFQEGSSAKYVSEGVPLQLAPEETETSSVSISRDAGRDSSDGTFISLGTERAAAVSDSSGFRGETFSINKEMRPIAESAPAPAVAEPLPQMQDTKPSIVLKPLNQPSPAAAKTPAVEEQQERGGKNFFSKFVNKFSASGKTTRAEPAAPKPAPLNNAKPAAKTPAPESSKPAANDAPKRSGIIVGDGSTPSAKPFQKKPQPENKPKEKTPAAPPPASAPPRPVNNTVHIAPVKKRSETLASEIPVDDIFAANTIVGFYNDAPALRSAEEEEAAPNHARHAPHLPEPQSELLEMPENLFAGSEPGKANQKAPAWQEDKKPQTAAAPPQSVKSPDAAKVSITAAETEKKMTLKPSEPSAPQASPPPAPAPSPAPVNPTPKPAAAAEKAVVKKEEKAKVDWKPVEEIKDNIIDLTQKQMPFGKIEKKEEKKKKPQEFDIHEIAAQSSNLSPNEFEETPPPPPAKKPAAGGVPYKKNISGEKQMTQPEKPQDNMKIKPIAPAAPGKPSAPKPPAAPPPAPAPAAAPPPREGHLAPGPAQPPVAPAVPKPSAPQKEAPTQMVTKHTQPVRPRPAAAEDGKTTLAEKTATIDHTIQMPAGQVYKRSNWPLEIPLIPTFTFDTMDMASNRFSHANAMSVVDNIGTVYNPFFIFGESGSGKTHFLHAMGYELSKKVPQEKIFVTNGVRFARGIQRYVEEGKVAKLEEIFNTSEVLIIDDVHLTAVNEHNREIISRILNRFLKEKKQIIISSKYPPESLARLEELVSFKLDQGWVSELKPPRPQHFTRIYNRMCDQAGLGLSAAQAMSFFGGDRVTLGKVARDIRRVKVLHRRIFDSGSPEKSYEALLTEMLVVSGENEHSEIIKKEIAEITTLTRMESTEWGNFGFFFPQGQEDKFNWAAFSIAQKAKELGIKGGLHFALKSAYSTENIISSAFKIANICDNKNLKGAIVLGPSMTVTFPPIRENFYDILSHMLEVMMIRCGIVDAEFIKNPSVYIKVLGDIIK